MSPSVFSVLATLLAFAGQPAVPSVLGLTAIVGAAPIIPPTGADDTCPSPRQVSEALQAHLPGLVLSPDRAAGRSDALRAVLDVPADGTVVHFSLVDARGDVQLRRSIPGPGRGHPAADCLALAETLAEIVERYLESVLYQAKETVPPLPPPPAPAPIAAAPPEPPRGRAAFMFVGGAWTMASADERSTLSARLGAEVELIRRPFALLARVNVGMAQEENVILTAGGATVGSASLRRFPAYGGLLLEIPAGPGTFEPGIMAGVEVLVATAKDAGTGRSDRSFRYSPALSAETGYRVTLGRHLFVRPRASLGFAIVHYDLAVGRPDDGVFRTSSTFSSFGLDAGLVFR